MSAQRLIPLSVALTEWLVKFLAALADFRTSSPNLKSHTIWYDPIVAVNTAVITTRNEIRLPIKQKDEK